jgi:hypothetical protein
MNKEPELKDKLFDYFKEIIFLQMNEIKDLRLEIKELRIKKCLD